LGFGGLGFWWTWVLVDLGIGGLGYWWTWVLVDLGFGGSSDQVKNLVDFWFEFELLNIQIELECHLYRLRWTASR
jgi:hypothetical protein